MSFQAESFIQKGIDHLFRFADPHSQTKHHKNFLKGCVEGLIGSQTCTLAGIARSTVDSGNFKTRCKQLSQGLAHMKAPWGELESQLLDDGAESIGKDHIIAVDIGDLSKDYALKMENLYSVYDGSTGEIGNGYEDFSIVGVSWQGNQQDLVPMYSHLSNAGCENYISQNAQIITAVDTVYHAVKPGYGIWVFDRGFDRAVLMDKIFFEKLDLRFIVRSTGVRLVHLVNKDGTISTQAQSIEDIASRVFLENQYGLVFPKVVGPLKVGFVQIQVTIEGFDDGQKVHKSRILNLVVIRNPDFETPVLLLTSLKVSSGTDAVLIFAYYLERWGIENFFRLKKTVLGWEKLQVQSLDSIRRLNWICNLTLFLVIAYYRQHPGFVQELCDRLLLHERKTDTLKIPYYRVIECLKVLLDDSDLLSTEQPSLKKNAISVEAPGHPIEPASLNVTLNKGKASAPKMVISVLNSNSQFQAIEWDQSPFPERQILPSFKPASIFAQVTGTTRKPSTVTDRWEEASPLESILQKNFLGPPLIEGTTGIEDGYLKNALVSRVEDPPGEYQLATLGEITWTFILLLILSSVPWINQRNKHM
jgi:hypothetical protein